MTNTLKHLNQERYAAAAQKYVISKVHASGMWLDDFVALADTQPDWRALDVATGGGHTALAFAKQVKHVIATDLTPRMLDVASQFIRAQAQDNVLFCGSDGEVLPFADASFDLVTCRVAAHHFPSIFDFMREASRVLRPNGVLMLHDHVVSSDDRVAEYVNAYEKLRDPAHARALNEYEWRGLFLDTGFKMTFVEERTTQHEVIPWAKRQNCSDETIERLQIMLLRAPQAVKAWMQPHRAGTELATYTDHHIIIRGVKRADA